MTKRVIFVSFLHLFANLQCIVVVCKGGEERKQVENLAPLLILFQTVELGIVQMDEIGCKWMRLGVGGN